MGKIKLEGKVVLAPLSGVADSPFRLIAKSFGAALVYTEMVSAEGIIRDTSNTLRLLQFKEEERPLGIQIFGKEPAKMAKAASLLLRFNPDLIDINFGCPVKKVIKKNGGAAVLKDLKLLENIVRSVVQAVDIPVTVKIRSGWDEKNIVAVEAAGLAESAGASAVALHPRTQKAGFSGKADWELIAQVKSKIKIFVIGSGDIFTPGDVKNMLEKTGCDLVMVGRGSLGNPWIFSRSNHLLETGELLPEPTFEKRIEVCLRHADLLVKEKGGLFGIRQMRKHIVWYTKGMPQAAEFRKRIFTLGSFSEIKESLLNFLAQISSVVKV